MAENKVVVQSGISGTTLLFLVFLVLKLTHVINWSWWWVLAPIWIPIALVLLILIVGLIAMLID